MVDPSVLAITAPRPTGSRTTPAGGAARVAEADDPPIDVETTEDGAADHDRTAAEPEPRSTHTSVDSVLADAMTIDGATCAALVDKRSGMTLAAVGRPADFDVEVAAAGMSVVMQAQERTLRQLRTADTVEDLLVTLGDHYQFARPVGSGAADVFLYLVVDRAFGNLAMARLRLTALTATLRL